MNRGVKHPEVILLEIGTRDGFYCVRIVAISMNCSVSCGEVSRAIPRIYYNSAANGSIRVPERTDFSAMKKRSKIFQFPALQVIAQEMPGRPGYAIHATALQVHIHGNNSLPARRGRKILEFPRFRVIRKKVSTRVRKIALRHSSRPFNSPSLVLS